MIQTHDSAKSATPKTGALLSAKNLSVRFGGVLAVNGVSFDVKRGEVFTLIGPNGAGKTTVFNLISRIYTPTTGEILFEGRKLSEVAPHDVARLGIARTFQNVEVFEHAELLLLDEPSSGLNVEETDDMAFWIRDIQQELGVTVLMVEHDMSLVSKVSDRVLAMNQGEMLALGTPRDVQAHPGVIEAYLGSVDDVSSLRRAA